MNLIYSSTNRVGGTYVNANTTYVTTASNYQVRMTPGTSHILARANESALGEEDTSPSFGTMEDVTSLQVKPVGASYNPQVAVFVAAV